MLIPSVAPTVEANAATLVVAANNSLNKDRADYICNGVNDHVKIQTAIDRIATDSAYGGRLAFMEGNYNIEAAITGRSLIIYDGCTVGMWGKGTTFTLAGNGYNIMNFSGQQSFEINRIKFDGNNKTGKALNLVNCHNLHITKSYFTYSPNAFYIERGWYGWIRDCNFLDCGAGDTLATSAVGLYNGATNNTNNLRFLGCRFEYLNGIGIYSDVSGNYGLPQTMSNNHQILIQNCKFETVPGYNHVAIYGVLNRSRIIANTFWYCQTKPMIQLISPSTMNIIGDNSFGNAQVTPIVIGGSRNSIRDNTVEFGVPSHETHITDGDRNRVMGNIVDTNTWRVLDAGTNTRILHNEGAE